MGCSLVGKRTSRASKGNIQRFCRVSHAADGFHWTFAGFAGVFFRIAPSGSPSGGLLYTGIPKRGQLHNLKACAPSEGAPANRMRRLNT